MPAAAGDQVSFGKRWEGRISVSLVCLKSFAPMTRLSPQFPSSLTPHHHHHHNTNISTNLNTVPKTGKLLPQTYFPPLSSALPLTLISLRRYIRPIRAPPSYDMSTRSGKRLRDSHLRLTGQMHPYLFRLICPCSCILVSGIKHKQTRSFLLFSSWVIV